MRNVLATTVALCIMATATPAFAEPRARLQVDTSELGKLAVFAGVREFPMRVKCATLAWHTFKAALEGGNDAATTE